MPIEQPAVLLGLGALLLGGVVAVWRLRRRAARWRDLLPRSAGPLGLTFFPPGEPSAGHWGALRGVYRGRRVRVGLLDIRVDYRARQRVDLASDEQVMSRPGGAGGPQMVRFTSGRQTFDRLFRHRLATPRAATLIQRHPQLTDRLVQLHELWRANRPAVHVGPESLRCQLRTPPRSPEQLGLLLEDLHALCLKVESVLADQEPDPRDLLRQQLIEQHTRPPSSEG